MKVMLSSSVFAGSATQPGRITQAMVTVMNRSTEFQRLFALAEANRVLIRIGEEGETGTFFDPPRGGRNSAIVLSRDEFSFFAANPAMLVARIGHEIAHALDFLKVPGLLGADGLTAHLPRSGSAPGPSNAGPADYSRSRANDEGLALTEEFIIARELGLKTFSPGAESFARLDAMYNAMRSAGLSDQDARTSLIAVTGAEGRNLTPSTNAGLNQGLTYGQVDIKTYAVNRLGFTDAAGRPIGSENYPTSLLVNYQQDEDGSYSVTGINPTTGELVTRVYDSANQLVLTTTAAVDDMGNRRERLAYSDGRTEERDVSADGTSTPVGARSWWKRVFSDGSDAIGGAETGPSASPAVPPTSGLQDYFDGSGSSFAPTQRSALAVTLGSLNLGDTDELNFVSQPGGGSTLIQSADGDIVGEITQQSDGTSRVSAVRINADGSSETVVSYINVQGEALTPDQYETARTQTTASAMALLNSIIGLSSWSQMSELQRTAAVAGIYNAVDRMSGGQELAGDLGTATSVLGLLSALEQRDIGRAIVSGVSLVDSVASGMASRQIGTTLGMEAAQVVPVLGLALAVESGDTLSMIAAAANFIPVYGQIISLVITIFGSMLADDDIPMREGLAHAQWDAQGNPVVVTDLDAEGGGATATGWMQSLVDGLRQQLGTTRDADGKPVYALVPGLLPAIGFQYDPDGFNLANGAKGFLYLRWTDERGQAQTRYYDGAGSRGDGSGETLAGDFVERAMGAVAPAWQAETMLAHWQRDGVLEMPDAALPQELANGVHQSLNVLGLASPEDAAPREALIDIDGDGYLERTQWVAAHQAMLAIDADSDGRIGAGELLTTQEGAHTNGMRWLDANADGLLDARDPAFAALRLWLDANGDGVSAGETRTLAQAGIEAIDFGTNPPHIVRADGTRQALSAQMLTGDVLGRAYAAIVGGVLESGEDGTRTLHAANTREFDGRAGHTQGGDVDADGNGGSGSVTIDAGDKRLLSTSARTQAAQNRQRETTIALNDARIAAGTAGRAQAGQGSEQAQSAAAPVVRNNGIVYLPAGAQSAAQQQREVMAAWIRGADNPLFGLGAVGTPLMVLATAAAAGSVRQPRVIDAPPLQAVAADALPPPAGSYQAVPLTPHDSSQTAVIGSEPPPVPGKNEGGKGAGAGAIVSDPIMEWVTPTSLLVTSAGKAPTEIPFTLSTSASSAVPANSAGSGTADMRVDLPRLRGEQAEGTEDVGLRFAQSLLLANDSTLNTPPSGQPALRIISVSAPRHGTVSLQRRPDGTTEVVFIPEADYHGPAQFSYTVADAYGLTRTATVALDLQGVNDAPVARDEAAAGDEDHALLFTAASLLANDIDVDTAVDGDLLRITRVGAAEHGVVTLLPDGTARFVPDADYNGPARFSYWVGDRDAAAIAAGNGWETQATLHLTVLPVNDLPVVRGEAIDSDEDVILRITPALLLANDRDADTATNAQVLAISAVGHAQHGQVLLLPDGTLRFTPERDYSGTAGFSYTVDDGHGGRVQGTVVIALAPVNDAPMVVGEDIAFDEDQVQTIDPAALLANDSDVDTPWSRLRIVAVDNAMHGTVRIDPSGAIRFAPEADYFGAASFTYTVSDGAGGFTVGVARLDIAPINDAPRLRGEALALDEDTRLRIDAAALLANDTDVDGPHGQLRISGVGNATHGTVQRVGGEIVFAPDTDFSGEASFTYTVGDGVGGQSQATVKLMFNPVNDAPVANDELLWGKQGVAYTLTQAALLANDTDVEDAAALRIVEVRGAQNGTAVLNPDGSVSFTPDAGYAGRGTFDYVVRDPQGAQAIATAQIDFSRVNVNPIATDDSFIGYEDVAFGISAAQLLINDSDADNTALQLRVTAVDSASHGTVSMTDTGDVSFTPDANFHGAASFRYQVSDSDGGHTWATAVLNVQSVNDAPVVEDIWAGRPIYGYRWEPTLITGGKWGGKAYEWSFSEVTSEPEARALLADPNDVIVAPGMVIVGGSARPHTLLDAAGSPLTPGYYLNGELRPSYFDHEDATRSTLHYIGSASVNDPYRQNGGIVAYDPDGDSSAITFSIAESPQHGHAWANQYVTPGARPGLDHTQVDTRWIGEAGAWQYLSHRGDPYSGEDPFMVRVTDGDGASTSVRVAPVHTGSSANSGGGGSCPIVIDLQNDGIELLRPEDSNMFADINGDGWRERIGWAAPSDAVLVFDANGDGCADLEREVSFVGYLPQARTDLEGLAAFDTDGDGSLGAADADWKRFGLFQDLNANGRQDEGEYRTLQQADLARIGLRHEGSPVMNNGNVVFGSSDVQWADGRTTRAGDVMFAGENVPLPDAAAEALAAAKQQESEARVRQIAVLFNQLQNTASRPADESFGFVPLDDGSAMQAVLAHEHTMVQAGQLT